MGAYAQMYPIIGNCQFCGIPVCGCSQENRRLLWQHEHSALEIDSLQKAHQYSISEVASLYKELRATQKKVASLQEQMADAHQIIAQLQDEIKRSGQHQPSMIQYGSYQSLRIIRGKLSREEIFHQIEASAFSYQCEAETQLDAIREMVKPKPAQLMRLMVEPVGWRRSNV